MTLDKQKIGDGLFLSAINTDKFKASVLSFSITLPLTTKSLAYNLILSGLLRRGTQKHPSMSELNKSLDELYGSYVEIRSSHIGNNISLCVSAEILDNRYIPDGTDTLGGVIDIVSQIFLEPLLTCPNFDKETFAQECRIVIEALNSEINNTRSYTIRRCLELVQKNHPTIEQIKEAVSLASLEEVIDYYKEIINTPLDVFYVGATPYEKIQKKVISAFEKYPCRNNSRNIIPITPISSQDFVFASEKMPVTQGKLAMAFNTGACASLNNSNYYTALVLNEILGGSAASKLFINVRERMGICYHCSSSYSIYTGIITVSSGFNVSRFNTVKDAIMLQIEQIKKGEVTTTELEAAKKSLLNSYRQLYDNPFDLQYFYGGRAIFGISDTIEDCAKAICEVSLEQIIQLSSQISLDATFFVEGTAMGCDEEDVNE